MLQSMLILWWAVTNTSMYGKHWKAKTERFQTSRVELSPTLQWKWGIRVLPWCRSFWWCNVYFIVSLVKTCNVTDKALCFKWTFWTYEWTSFFPHCRWTISWSPGPAPLGLITLPRSSGNWAAGPASVSRRRRRLASRQTTQPPVCLYTHRQMHKWGLTVLYTVRLNRSGDWQESQRRWEQRAGTYQEDLSLLQLSEVEASETPRAKRVQTISLFIKKKTLKNFVTEFWLPCTPNKQIRANAKSLLLSPSLTDLTTWKETLRIFNVLYMDILHSGN